jgi:Flp pilus assembly protein TadG
MMPGRRQTRGQSLAEFAIVLPLLLLLFMGVVDFGRAIYAYNTVSNAARDGARKAIVDQRVVSGVAAGAQEAASQATALGLNPTDVNQVRVEYLLPDLTGPCPTTFVEWQGCVARVRVQWKFSAITPIVGTVVGPITLSSTTSLPIERTQRT